MAPLVKLTIFKPIEVYISNIKSHLLQYRHLHVNNGYCYCINFTGGVTRKLCELYNYNCEFLYNVYFHPHVIDV